MPELRFRAKICLEDWRLIIRGYRLVLTRWWVVLRSEVELVVVSVVLDSRTEPALLSSSCSGDGEGSGGLDDLWVTMLLADLRAFASKVDMILVVSGL